MVAPFVFKYELSGISSTKRLCSQIIVRILVAIISDSSDLLMLQQMSRL